MAWLYKQSSGELIYDGEVMGHGYSGCGAARNQHNCEDEPNKGPIPCNTYTIGPPFNDPHLGPHVMHLFPHGAGDMHHRSGFCIHGDNKAHDASHGCLVFDPNLRYILSVTGDRELEVVA